MGIATLGKKSAKDQAGASGKKGKKKKSKGSGKFFALVLYSLACAVGGAWVDRHYVPDAMIWLGQQAQPLADLGSEQRIRGLIEKADITPSAKQAALRNVDSIHQARAGGRLSASLAELLARAEAPFVAAASRGSTVPADALEESLKLFQEIADDL